MGDKRHGPGSSLTIMPLAGRTKCELPDLPGPFNKKINNLVYLKSQAFTLEWDLHRLLSQMSLFLRLKCSHTCTQDLQTDRQIHTRSGYCTLNVQLNKKIALLNT